MGFEETGEREERDGGSSISKRKPCLSFCFPLKSCVCFFFSFSFCVGVWEVETEGCRFSLVLVFSEEL